MFVGIILTACLVFATANAADGDFSYDKQDEWPGACMSGKRQSPINIMTKDVKASSRLTKLQLGDGWRMSISGIYKNNGPGKNVQFDPTDSTRPPVITTNYLGKYRVLQMHMHWGANNMNGSEHTVDNGSYPLELHFVHQKMGKPNSTLGDDFAVIGVFAEADDNMEISGVWEQLDISAIRSFNTNISVSGLNYSDLLPSSLDYYHYPGSLTTPGCNEVVQWFVLKKTIKVPSQYLTSLRMIESADGPLTLNFRDVQPLGQRMVETPGSETPVGGSPKLVASALSILVAIFMTLYFS